ncbi:hypothetical protein PRIC1_010380 [Phytophthora ramorum]
MQTPERDGGGGMLSGSPTPTREHSTLLREQEAERERLRMDNFNQALRINFLEERLLRVKQGTDFTSEDLENELAQLRIALEEREHELQQRNFSMIRATEAIDMLNAQLHEARVAAANAREDAQRDAEAQLQQMIQARGDVDAERWRHELEMAENRERQSLLKAQELEQQLQRQGDAVATLSNQVQELQDARTRDQRETELRTQREQQNMQQVEMANVKLSAEAEHWKVLAKQREEQLATLQVQVEAMRQEKQTQDARYQAKLKRMEEQVQHQMKQLQRESDNYRTEHTRLLTDREKTHFDKERLAMENESIKQERVRLQAEIERMTNERQQLAGETERLRLQNAKLTAACEEQNKSLESFKAEREATMDTIHQLESELHQRRKLEHEQELKLKTLESRLEHAEAETHRMKEQCDLAESRCQQTSNERLLALEKDRQAMEEDNRRLRTELSAFQLDLEAMERKVLDSEERFSKEAANSQEQHQHLSAYEEELEQQSAQVQNYQKQLADCEDELAHRGARLQEMERQHAQVQEYQEQLAACEDELTRRATRLQELECQLAEAVSASSSTSIAARQQQTEWHNQFAMEKTGLLRQLEEERRRADDVERAASALRNDSSSAQRELEAVEMELRSLLMSRSRAIGDGRHQSVVSLAREAISALKNEFKAEAAALQTGWKQQSSLMGSKLDRLSTQLRSSQSKLEVLERSSFHAKDSKQSSEKTWSIRYEELRLEKEDEHRSLEEEIHYFQTKAAEAEEALSLATSNMQALKRDQKGSREESERDYHGLKESNRLLFEEVQERRRSAEHVRKQYMHAIRENKELLKAIDMYKDAIADRDEKYKAAVMKHAQQLKRRVEFGEVKQTLLEQLEQTQYMISETYKRWEDSPIVRGPTVNAGGRDESYEAAILQLDEYIGRMHLVSERWGEFMTQSQELHHRYGDAWNSASRGFDRTKDQPRWVSDVERKCSRLLTEALRVSEAMRDVVNNIAGVLQKERDEKKRIEKERAIAVDNNASVKRREDTSSKWAPLGAAVFDEHQNQSSSRSANQPQSRAQSGLDAPRRSSKTLNPAHRSVNALYRSSLSSLGRVGMKMQDLEKEIRSAHD